MRYFHGDGWAVVFVLAAFASLMLAGPASPEQNVEDDSEEPTIANEISHETSQEYSESSPAEDLTESPTETQSSSAEDPKESPTETQSSPPKDPKKSPAERPAQNNSPGKAPKEEQKKEPCRNVEAAKVRQYLKGLDGRQKTCMANPTFGIFKTLCDVQNGFSHIMGDLPPDATCGAVQETYDSLSKDRDFAQEHLFTTLGNRVIYDTKEQWVSFVGLVCNGLKDPICMDLLAWAIATNQLIGKLDGCLLVLFKVLVPGFKGTLRRLQVESQPHYELHRSGTFACTRSYKYCTAQARATVEVIDSEK